MNIGKETNRFGKSGQPRNSQSARRWFLSRPLWNVKVGSNVKSIAEHGLAMLNVVGLYLVGVSKTEVNLDLNIFHAIGGQKRVQGVIFGSTNFMRDIPMYAELHLRGRINLDDLVSKRIALRDVNDGYAALRDGSLKQGRRHVVLT